MPNVRYNLKPGPAPNLIILLFRFSGSKFQYSTGQKIDPKFWDKGKCRAKNVRLFPEHRSINEYLDKLERIVNDTHREFISEHYDDRQRPGLPEIKTALKSALDKATLKNIKTAPEKTLFGFIAQLIREREVMPQYKRRTIINYRNALNNLRAFDSTWRKSLDFSTVDLDFSYDFRAWMYGRGMSTNYTHKILQQVRVFMNEAFERGLHQNRAHESKRFQIPEEEVQNIYLTVDEIAEVYRLELDSRLSKVRDLFIIGAFTGLRFSDFSRIRPYNVREIDGVKVIQMTVKKTEKQITIPVHPFVETVLSRNGNRSPKISAQKFNEYVKELCGLTSWGSEPVTVDERRGDVRFSRKVEKASLVSSHTCRRSFCTNAYKAGVPVIDIMKISGHRTERNFLKYIKVSGEEHARIISKHDFFNQVLFKIG